MARRMMNRLKASQLAQLPPGTHCDGGGLNLKVQPSGSRSFVLRLKIKDGPNIEIGVGGFPLVSLKEARQDREKYRRLTSRGIDPRQPKTPKFERVAEDWLKEKMTENPSWHEHPRFKTRMRKHIVPVVRDLGIDKVTHIHVNQIRDRCKSISEKKACVRHVSQVLSYAMAQSYRGDNPAREISKQILKPPVQHRVWVQPERLREMIGEIAASDCVDDTTKRLILFLIFVPVRKSEAQHARWEEFNGNLWTIPSERFKTRKAFQLRVPRTAMQLLGEPKKSGFVFPTIKGRSISNTVLDTIRTKTLKLESTFHGFRHTYETKMVSTGHDENMVHRSTGHKIQDGTQKTIYQHHQYVEERFVLLQEWNAWLMVPYTKIESLDVEDVPAEVLKNYPK